MKLRVGKNLLALMIEAKERWGNSFGEQAKTAARWGSRRNIDTAGIEDPGTYDGTVISLSGLEIEPAVLRKWLFMQLTAELAAAKKRKAYRFETKLVEGKDYIVGDFE